MVAFSQGETTTIMYRLIFLLALSLLCVNASAGCGEISETSEPNLNLRPDRYSIDVMVINETGCEITVSSDAKLFREVILVFRNSVDRQEVGVKKIADHFDPGDSHKLSRGAFLGRRFSYDVLSDYFYLIPGCYEVSGRYAYNRAGAHSESNVVASQVIDLCLERDQAGSLARIPSPHP